LKDTFELGAIFKLGELSDGSIHGRAGWRPLPFCSWAAFDSRLRAESFRAATVSLIKFYTLDTFVNGYRSRRFSRHCSETRGQLVPAAGARGLTAAHDAG